jgi:hypothetical protein
MVPLPKPTKMIAKVFVFFKEEIAIIRLRDNRI